LSWAVIFLMIAENIGHVEIVEMLKKAGAKESASLNKLTGEK